MPDLTNASIARRAFITGVTTIGAAGTVLGPVGAVSAHAAEGEAKTITSVQTTVFADLEVACDFDGAAPLSATKWASAAP